MCHTCNFLNREPNFISTTFKTSFSKPSPSSPCSARNLIYLITCTKCELQYIGETGDTLRNRLNNHRSDIKNKKQTAVGVHFNTLHHTMRDISITPIEILETDSIEHRKNREYYWQNKLGTIYPRGLNGLPLEFLDLHHYRKSNPLLPPVIINNTTSIPNVTNNITITDQLTDVTNGRNNNNNDNTNTLTINLANFSPSPADLSLLEKGLSFIPTPKLLPVKNIITNKNQLLRTLKLRDHFREHNSRVDPKHKTFTEQSNWTPNMADLSAYTINTIEKINACTNDFLSKQTTRIINNSPYIQLKEKFNLTQEETSSINLLKNNKNITIKPADKGGATVILNTQNYIAEANRQLANTTYYKPLLTPIFMDNKPRILEILNNMQKQKIINNKQLKFLSGPDDYKQRTFYLLPKIHKDRDSWPQPNCPAGRPIVSDVNSESYRVSEYIDYYLNPLATKHPSYVKNTYDFLGKIRGQLINNNCLLVTADVESLYTNMNINRTITCIKTIFRKKPAPGRPDKHIIDLLDLTLKNNDFEFNGDYYLQTCGTAMGKKYAPSLANIYLLDFDNQAMNNFRVKPLLYFRYLDDIFFVWPGTEQELTDFETFLNNITIGIKIKLEPNMNSVNFLDTTIYKSTTLNQTTLQSRVFFKATDTHQLLDTSSFHPKHTTKGILKSQLIRFKRINSTQDDYIKTCKVLFSVLVRRGYSLRSMRTAMYDILYNYTEPVPALGITPELIPIIIDHNSISTKLAREYREIIEENIYFKDSKIIIAHRNPKNLKQHLVRSKLN